jgi:hypothetical protein
VPRHGNCAAAVPRYVRPSRWNVYSTSHAMDGIISFQWNACKAVDTGVPSAARSTSLEPIAAIPSAENMPSGSAQKPGDVIRHYGGKTSEVLNTDAEGRLILADALALLAERRPACIVDTAITLVPSLRPARIGWNFGSLSVGSISRSTLLMTFLSSLLPTAPALFSWTAVTESSVITLSNMPAVLGFASMSSRCSSWAGYV